MLRKVELFQYLRSLKCRDRGGNTIIETAFVYILAVKVSEASGLAGWLFWILTGFELGLKKIHLNSNFLY